MTLRKFQQYDILPFNYPGAFHSQGNVFMRNITEQMNIMAHINLRMPHERTRAGCHPKDH